MDQKGIEIRRRNGGPPTWRARVRRGGLSLRADFGTPEEAIAWRARTLRDVREGRAPSVPDDPAPPPARPAVPPKPAVSLEDACNLLVRGMADGSIRTKRRTPYKPSVIDKYESMLRVHALDPDRGLGPWPLDRIEPADAREFINGLATRTSPGTAHKVLTALKVVGRQAVADRILSLNPFASVTAPQTDDPPKEARLLTPAEAERIRAAARGVDSQGGVSRAYPLITLAFATGLRCGELLALRYGPDSLDLGSGRITVGPKGNLGRKRGLDGKFPLIRPKSKTSERIVEIPDSALQVLREHRLATGRPPDGAFVFADARGDPICGATVAYRAWRRTIEAAGIEDPRPRFHDTRHHWAVVMLRAGVQPQAVAKLGGWASVAMVHDRYGKHAFPSELAGTGAKLDAYLTSERTG